MLDIKLIRDDVEEVIRRLNTRGKDYSYLREVKKMDEERRDLITKADALKNERNENHTISSVGLWYFFLSCSFILTNTF